MSIGLARSVLYSLPLCVMVANIAVGLHVEDT
jgi:hypothetical protein